MMKKSFFITLLFLFSLDFVFAQSYVSQVVLPKKIYVGDVAEIRVSFSSGIDFFADLPATQAERKLSLSNLGFDTDNEDFLLKDAILRRTELNYTLILFVMPWNTGEIKIPSINLTAGIYTDEKMPFVIPIETFAVSSILTKGVESSMVPPVPPLLIPGTTYFLYGFIILFIVFLIFFFRLLFNWSKLVGKIKNYKLKKTYIQNKKFTLKQLKKLEKKYSKMSDEEFCTELVLIIRNYLKVRYGQSFDSIPTSIPRSTSISAALASMINPFLKASSGIYFAFSPNTIPHSPFPSYTVGIEQDASILAAGEKNISARFLFFATFGTLICSNFFMLS
jgi:hypothetical protein